MWLDGVCKKCNSIVLETGCGSVEYEGTDEAKYSDYKNTCSNHSCENFKWHYVGDMEELDYYHHGFENINEINIEGKIYEIKKS